MTINSIFIAGSGLMGSGIAQVCAQAGIEVTLNDISAEALSKGLSNIDWSVGKLIAKSRLHEDKETILGRIKTAADFAKAFEADLAIEAVFENLELKQNIFRKLDATCNPDAFLASNTSAIPITVLAAVTRRPDRVLGLHFFNPVVMMQTVEVVRGFNTSEAAMQAGVDIVRHRGRYRQRGQACLWPAHGAFRNRGYGGPGCVLRRPDSYLRRMSGYAFLSASDVEAEGDGRTTGPQDRQRMVRL